MKRLLILLSLLVLLTVSQVSAVTPLGPGYYQYSNAALVYTGSWTNVTSDTASYGDSYTYAGTSGRATLYTLPTVGRLGLYYVQAASGGSFEIAVNGAVAAIGNSSAPSAIRNNYLEVTLPYGTNRIELYSVSGNFLFHAVQLITYTPTAAAVNVTAVMVFPTHTPTPTATPTLTPTTGPSPTPTRTPTATPNFVARSVINTDAGAQDVGVVYQMSAGDVGIVVGIGVLIGLQVITMFMAIRREK